jgi:cyanate permease
MSASSILRSFATGFEALFVTVALFGIGGAMVSIGTPKLIAIWFTGRERGMASGINSSGSAAGSMAALSLTNSIVLPLVGDWRNVFRWYGLVGFAVASVWLILGDRPRVKSGWRSPTQQRKKAEGRSTFRELLKHRDIWIIVLIGVNFFFTIHGLQNWLPRILELKGLSPADAGYATSLMTLAGIIGSLVIPRFIRRPRYAKAIIAGVLLVSGVAILVLGVAQGLSLWVGILLTGFFTRALLPVLMTVLMDIPEVGADRMGAVGGLFFAIGEIGGFLGPLLMGYIKDATGSFLLGIYFLAAVTEVTIIATAFLNSEANEH